MNALSYGLSQKTVVRFRDDGVQLVLRYPLKTIALHKAWREVFERLIQSPHVPFKDLAALKTGIEKQKIAGFLNQLVLKGFLERTGIDPPDWFPKISVIIPVRNRPSEVDECLRSLEQLDYPTGKLEVMVVDDASEDDTPQTVQKYPVRLIRLEDRCQASYCRNLGAEEATGEILAFIDSDCVADPGWLKQLISAFDDPHLAALGGRVDAYFDQTGLDRYEKAESSLMVSSYAKRTQPDDPFFYVPACNFLVRRDLFLKIGGFNVDLSVGEDVDLCWRLQKQGHTIEFRPQGSVYHKHRNRLAAFCKRRFEYGTSEPLLQKMHPDRVKRFLIPPTAAAIWALLIGWALTGQPFLGGLAGLVAITDGLIKIHRYKHFELGFGLIFLATLRGYAAFFYHVCAFVSRYYLIWGLLLLPFAPMATLVVGAMHLANGIVEYHLKRPKIALPLFIVLFTLEQLSYQAGVWWGCIRHGLLSPVLPKPVLKIPSKNGQDYSTPH